MTALLFAALAASAAAAPVLTVQARAVRRGEVLLVVVEGADPRKAPAGELQGRALTFFPAASTGTWLALAGVDLEASTGPALLRAAGVERALDIAAGEFPEQRLEVEPRYVTPSKSDAERAENEAALLRRLFAAEEGKRLFEGRFDPPIPGAATGRFGERRVFNGQPRAPHSGMDLKAKAGVPVRAPAAGRVLLAGPLYYAGNTVLLDHGLGLTTLYAHLSRMKVRRGDLVRKGQVIGLVGATGRVTGPHLHWALKHREARVDPYSLAFLDLDAYLKPRPPDPLVRSPACALEGLPPPGRWGKVSGGLRARLRPARAAYAPGEPASLLVELGNAGGKPLFLDFVRDPQARGVVLGLARPPRPFSQLASSGTARLVTEQVRVPPGKALCFEQDRDSGGPVLTAGATSYALVYDTSFLYTSTSTARAGIWRGRVWAPAVPLPPAP